MSALFVSCRASSREPGTLMRPGRRVSVAWSALPCVWAGKGLVWPALFAYARMKDVVGAIAAVSIVSSTLHAWVGVA